MKPAVIKLVIAGLSLCIFGITQEVNRRHALELRRVQHQERLEFIDRSLSALQRSTASNITVLENTADNLLKSAAETQRRMNEIRLEASRQALADEIRADTYLMKRDAEAALQKVRDAADKERGL